MSAAERAPHRSRLAFAGLLAVALCSGCAFAPGMHVKIDEKQEVEGNYRVVPVSAALIREQRQYESKLRTGAKSRGLPALNPKQSSRPYLVGPGDVLMVKVWSNPELAGRDDPAQTAGDGVEVGPDGQVYFPYAGLVTVGGLSVEQIRALLTKRLAEFLRSPQLDVRVAAFRSQRVQVTGEVVQPGVVALDNTSKGVLEALTERGGLSERASRRRVYLSRGDTRYEIELDRLYGGDFGSMSPYLQPGDVIRVPDTAEDQVVVLGAVEAPKSVPMSGESLSAISAIAAAGGVSRNNARGSDIYVFRASSVQQPEAGEIQVYQIDMSVPQGLLYATNFVLHPRDVVYVAATELSRFNSVVQQLLPTLQEIFYVDRLTGSN